MAYKMELDENGKDATVYGSSYFYIGDTYSIRVDCKPLVLKIHRRPSEQFLLRSRIGKNLSDIKRIL